MYKANVFIGSKECVTGEYVPSYSPIDDTRIGEYAQCDEGVAKEALRVAKRATVIAKNTPLSKRIAWLNDVADRLATQKELFAETITNEVGKPIRFSLSEVDRCIETLRLSAAQALSIGGETMHTDAMPSGKSSLAFFTRVPCGVIVAITPFNFPLNLIAHKLAPALVSGNSVVLKPTPEAPYTAYLFAKLFIESSFAVSDALSLVYGDADIGSTLVTSDIPRVVSFTGSAAVGKIITQTAGIKKISLELGGNAATFIDDSADIADAAIKCANASFVNSGQVCISLQRIYVAERIYEAFSNAFVNEAKKLNVGNPRQKETFLGPLVSDDAALRAQSWLDSALQEGARILTGGVRNGRYMEPTVVADVRDDMKIVCEEVFAPIVSLVKVRDFDEALVKMNDSIYGLQHSVFSNDHRHIIRAIDELDAGGVVINDVPTLRFDIQPYGGAKMSGIGKEGPFFAMEEFTEIKSVVIV